MPEYLVVHTSPDAEYIETGRNAAAVARKVERSVGRIGPIHKDGPGVIFCDDQNESVYIYPAREAS